MVIQREVGTDVKGFPTAIEAPDIILVGEMRDSETMRAASSAATSGHTVSSTIHCESTEDAPTRILDSIEAARVSDVRSQLSRSLKVVVYQKLLPKKGGDGRALATELMLVNPAISNAIRTHELSGIQGPAEQQGDRVHPVRGQPGQPVPRRARQRIGSPKRGNQARRLRPVESRRPPRPLSAYR